MKKCFTLTLIIIILAIVALIVTPIILNGINDAKISAGMSKASMIYSEINNYCAKADTQNQLNGEANICADGVTVEEVKDMVNLGNAKVNKVTYENGKLTELEVESNGHIFKLCGDGSFVMDDEVCETRNDEVAIIHTGSIKDVVLSNFPFLETDGNGCTTLGDNNYSYMGGCYLKVDISYKEDLYSSMLSEGFTSVEEIDDRFLDANGEFKNEEFENWYMQHMIDNGLAENKIDAQKQIAQFLEKQGVNTIFEALFVGTPEEYFSKLYNNYLWYSGFLWRIMGINADGSVRLITEENVTTIPWGAVNTAQNYDESYAKDWLNNYFYPKLKGNDIIVEQIWCSETTEDSSSARTSCSNNLSIEKAKVGLISLDEYNLAGAGGSYLNIDQDQNTLTPYNDYSVWSVYNFGDVYVDFANSTSGVRAVINVNSNANITGGNGNLRTTWSGEIGPYILNEDKNNSATGKLNEKATSGEYVLYAGKKYRVVDQDSKGNTKLILDGYYEGNGNVYEMKYGSYGDNNTFSTATGIGQKLNSNVLEWLVASSDIENRDKLVTNYTWYQNEFYLGHNYTVSLEENSPTRSVNATVGLIRIGEMLSGQSSSILTNGYTATSHYGNATYYWTMTPSISSYATWCVINRGIAYNCSVNEVYALRPVIVIKSNVNIISGNGTWSSPYEI